MFYQTIIYSIVSPFVVESQTDSKFLQGALLSATLIDRGVWVLGIKIERCCYPRNIPQSAAESIALSYEYSTGLISKNRRAESLNEFAAAATLLFRVVPVR